MNKLQFPRWDDLPNLDLYMDQVITYIQTTLQDTYFDHEKFITKAMVNNYVKTGIVEPPIKKHYTKRHVAYFLVVTILKRCYSMQQISQLIKIHTQMKNSSVEEAYNLFMTRLEELLSTVFDNTSQTNISFQVDKPEQQLMNHVIHSVVYKIHTEYILSKKES